MSGRILRDWFIPGSGIRREIISADLQIYLGSDATVRPGRDIVNGEEIKGYWVKAERTLTSNMLEDLKEKSRRWDKESQRSGRRGDYQDSHTFREANRRRARETDSPNMDTSLDEPRQRVPMPPPGPDFMDTRPEVRADPYRSYPIQPVGAIPGDFGDEPAYGYPPRGAQLPPGYVTQGNYNALYSRQPGYESPDHGIDTLQGRSSQYNPGYPGQYGQAIPPDDRGTHGYYNDQLRYPPQEESRNSRYPSGRIDPRQHSGRDEPRYQPGRDERREDPRYSSRREDPRYPPSRDIGRVPLSRDDARYPYDRDDPRYPSGRDDPRYSSAVEDPMYFPGRDEPRYPSGRDDIGQPGMSNDPNYFAGRGNARYQQGARDDMGYPPQGREDPRQLDHRQLDPRQLDPRQPDPRHPAGPGYQERYAYPSPATSTGSTVTAHDPMQSATQPSSYAQPSGQYDPYGRPYVHPSHSAQLLEEPFQPPPPAPGASRMEPPPQPQYSGSGRERSSASRDGNEAREARRRRLG